MNDKMIPGLKDEYSAKILGLFHKLQKPFELILFGSRARNTHREGSDIDLALKGNTITPEDVSELQLAYEDLYLPWKLDLIIYKNINEPALVQHIDRIGVTLMSKN